MITYQEEKLKDCLDEMKPLLENHWEEIALNKDKIKLSPNYDQYLVLEDSGMLHIVTVRDEGVLIGYYVSFITPHLHYSDSVYAMNDVLFLLPDYRSADIGFNMFTYVEKCLRDKGVDVMMLHMKAKNPFHSLCEAMGMELIEYNYAKFIGD